MGLTLLEKALSLVAPLECHICGDEGNMLCLHCRVLSLETQESRCYICNKLTKSHLVCSICRSRSRLRRVWWLGAHKTLLKELVWEIKYNRKRAYARELGTLLALTLPYLPEDTIVVSIPTASARIRARGYDQAVCIAEGFARARDLRLVPCLVRRTQVDQIGKRRHERLTQMERSLQIKNQTAITGQNIVLIDDVLTTGATLESAASVLRLHGAKHVDAAVITRQLPH